MIRIAFVIGDYPPEQRRLREDVARSYSSAEVEVGIVSVAARPFDGLGPAEIQAAAPLFHDAFRRAEREGYDAVVPLGMLDLGVDGGRSAVDIPVVAPLQAALHVAAQVGERFGVVCYHPSAIPRHRAQTRAYGMESFIAGRRASGFYLQHIADNRDQMVAVVPRGGARPDRGGRRRRHHPARHHPMPGADEAAMARGRARRPGGGRHRRADPDGGHAGGARAHAKPGALAEGRLAAAVSDAPVRSADSGCAEAASKWTGRCAYGACARPPRRASGPTGDHQGRPTNELI